MAATEVLHDEKGHFTSFSSFGRRKGESMNTKSQDVSIEKKIEFLENFAGKVSNRRSRRWLNDRLLMELVPRLRAEEIRGLFAPPPFGDDIPLSPFCMTNVKEWDMFRNIDMDKEAYLIEGLNTSSSKKRGCIDVDKAAVLNAWHRVDCRTRDAIRQSFLPELIKGYEDCLRVFITQSREEVLVLHVEDPFYRLLLHGVCEFYNLVSVTDTELKGGTPSVRATRIKKGRGCGEPPNITLSQFLKMTKEGSW